MKAGAAVGRRAGITGKRWVFISTLAIMGLLLFVPSFHNDYINLTFRNILMYAAMSYGWNLIGGYTGYVSFGNVAFFGIGAYCSAVLSKTGIDNVFADVGLALVVCALFAIVVGLPILRLRGHYFGIATLGVALGLTDLANNLDFVGGIGVLNVGHAHPKIRAAVVAQLAQKPLLAAEPLE